ncbi:pilus assembly protein [Tessaracoccus antarcticus]|uniref:Pilus assembly protein n=1 Tax=Tessaracoccus antarcticus TaxID=2479848 RepID=A0A3M0GS34_9ACTN|nr:pilus assembly protein [Tessaracoccus antarcticus]RMB60116.1 pilus assembly protein [Tessaracoccus antarcticus]
MALEAAVIIPVIVLFVGLVIILASDALAQQAVGAAASQAARAASLERSPQAARRAAESAVGAALSDSNVACREQSVSVDTAGLRAPRGTPARVTVTVTCVVAYDVSFPGFPEQRRMTQTRFSPVDTYRGR